MPLQILVTLFVYFAVSRIYKQLKAKTVSLYNFLFWFSLWSGVLILAYWPGVMSYISYNLGIGRGVDAIIYFGLMLSFYLNYRLYIKYEESSQAMTKIVREIALMEIKNEASFTENKIDIREHSGISMQKEAETIAIE